jgi:Fe-S-cluster containining protein
VFDPADAVARCREEVEVAAEAGLRRACGEEDLAALAAVVDAAVSRALAERDPAAPPPACGPGCARCCVLNVGTLAVEGAAAARHLRAMMPPGEAAALGRALLAAHDRVRWLEDRERIAHGVACPLLDLRGRCRVHPARPLACRSVTSVDAEDCRRVTEACDDEGEAPVVRMDVLQRVLYGEARAALAAVLARRGLDSRCRDVSGMVGAFLADPALVHAFLAGGRVPLE